jgi:hypothetical protein
MLARHPAHQSHLTVTTSCAGATGLVGSRLAAKLASQGNKVRVVTRNVNSAKSKLQYPGLEFYSLAQIADAVTGSDAVVNLAGEPIGTRWGWGRGRGRGQGWWGKKQRMQGRDWDGGAEGVIAGAIHTCSRLLP